MSERDRSEDQPTTKVCEFPPNSKSKEFQALVMEPEYVCADCGRSAANQENVCRPQRIVSAW
jgi:hypothetical protein